MPATTPYQGLPYPLDSDVPNIPLHLKNLAEAIEKKLVGTYNSQADRDARITAPTNGQLAYITGNNAWWVYDGSAWVRLYIPTEPAPTITASPNSPSGGVNGDVWFKI